MNVLKTEKGVALIMVLGIVLLLLSGGLAFIVKVKLTRAQTQLDSATLQSYWNAQAGLAEALHQVSLDTLRDREQGERVDNLNEPWSEKKQVALAQGGFEIEITDEASKINLNQSSVGEAHLIDLERAPLRQIDWLSYVNAIKPFQHTVQEALQYEQQFQKNAWSKIRAYTTAWSYEWNFDQVWKINLWDEVQSQLPLEDYRYIAQSGHNDSEQVALNIRDYIDQDFFLSRADSWAQAQDRSLIGSEPMIHINEVLYRSGTNSNGEYIELWNPYDQDIVLDNVRLAGPALNVEVLLSARTCPAGHRILITDDTKSLQAQGLSESDQVTIMEFPNLNLSKNELWIEQTVTNSGQVEVLSYDHVQLDEGGMSKSDPRSNDPKNWLKEVSPGEINPAYIRENGHQQLPSGVGLPEALVSLAQLKQVYRQDGPWSYLKLNAADIQSESKENTDFYVMDYVYIYPNSWTGFFDEYDHVATGYSKKRIMGKINLNTASQVVLECLPGMTPEIAQVIVSAREDNPYHKPYDFLWALKQANIDDQDIDQLWDAIVDLVTVKTETFHVRVKGYCQGQEYVLEAIIDRGLQATYPPSWEGQPKVIMSQKVRL